MSYTCDRCRGGYDVRSGVAVAHVFVDDSRCNHLETECPHCGSVEVIFLGPRRLEEAVREGRLRVRLAAEAGAALRRHAERAWKAVERRATAPAGAAADRAGAEGPKASGAGSVEPTRYELTGRHEQLLERFARTLDTIPDELLWDALESDHERSHPDRWVD